MVVSVVALLWATFQFLNIAWPRNFYPDTPFLNWSVALAVVGLGIVGAAIYAARRKHITIFPTFEVDDPEDDAETRESPATETVTTSDAGSPRPGA
jgi:hypothetical protein